MFVKAPLVARLLPAAILIAAALTAVTPITPRQVSPIRVVAVVPPPAGVPVYWSASSDRVTQVTAISWVGQRVGSMTFNEGVSLQDQAPDGSRLMVSERRGDAVISSDGRVLDFLTTYIGRWADDSRHLCLISTQLWEQGIVLALPGDEPVPVAQLGLIAGHGGFNPVACSPGSDRVVVAASFITQITSIAVYRVSDGAQLRSWRPARLTGTGDWIENVVASHDGHLVAENGRSGARIREVESGTELATVPAGRVLAFSWDRSRVLVEGYNARISVRDWQQGRDLWKACGFIPVAVRPAGADFMVGIRGAAPSELRVVDGEGRVTPIVGDALPANAYEVTATFTC